MLSCENAAIKQIYSTVHSSGNANPPGTTTVERRPRTSLFSEGSRLDIFLMINVFLCDVKKNLANLDKYDSENGVCARK